MWGKDHESKTLKSVFIKILPVFSTNALCIFLHCNKYQYFRKEAHKIKRKTDIVEIFALTHNTWVVFVLKICDHISVLLLSAFQLKTELNSGARLDKYWVGSSISQFLFWIRSRKFLQSLAPGFNDGFRREFDFGTDTSYSQQSSFNHWKCAYNIKTLVPVI